MKCNNCGKENEKGNKYCVECGNELKKNSNMIYCNNCGFENSISNNYCENCGAKISKPLKKTKNSRNKNHTPKKDNKRLEIIDQIKSNKLLAVILIFVVGLFIYKMLPEEKNKNVNNFTKPSAFVGFAGSRVADIASKFICSCGTCGELPLETCDCPTAREEKAFIQSQINLKKNDSQIIKAVNAKYGWIKPQYTNLLNSTGNGVKSSTINYSKMATNQDRNLIISQFRCPCGQCGVDELIECGCNHPNGATEVKGFIDSKIAQNNLTVGQIIELVDNTYGGKK